MQFLPLLNTSLKSDGMLQILELWDCDVTYAFDRNHENTPDQYWATAEAEGVQFRFDDQQILKTVFLYVSESDRFSAIDLSATDIPAFNSIADIRAYVAGNQIKKSEGQAEFLGDSRDWIRLESDTHHIHYEFRDGTLSLVTISVRCSIGQDISS